MTNPQQTRVRDAAAFLVSSNELEANRVIEHLGARYIAVDWQLKASSTLGETQKSLFLYIVVAAGGNPLDYCGVFSKEAASTDTPGKPVVYCYPEYYRSMAMRLYLYGGRAATPASHVEVVSSRREVRDNQPINVVTGNWSFASYEEAARFVASSGRTDAKIVSKNPLETCVPLEALTSYAPVFKSFEVDGTDPSAPAAVQLFEYRPYRRPGD